MNETNSVRASIARHLNEYFDNNKGAKTEFANKLGVSRTSVDRWTDCICAPDLELLPKISEIINVSVSELLGVDIISSKALTPELTNIVNQYLDNAAFKNIVDRYLKDESFRKSIDYLVSLK